MKNLFLLTIILLFSLSSCKFIKEKGWFGTGEADTLLIWHARQDSIRIAAAKETEIQRIKAVEQAKLDSLQAITEEINSWEAKFKYHIIVGSFLTPEFADDHVNLYKTMGYDAKVIDGPAYRFKFVSAEVHESVSTAINRLVQYQDTVEFEAWLYIKD